MKYNQLQAENFKKPKRLGRGIASGKGKTAGRGTKGQGARAGFSKNPGFAGGSNPLMQKLPKLPGFNSHRAKNEIVFIKDLNNLGKKIDAQVLYEAKLITSPYSDIKILANGDLSKAVEIHLPKISQTAKSLVEEKGGTFIKTEKLKRPKIKPSN